MAKLEQEIADTFLEKLRESKDLTSEMTEKLADLLSADKKLKADDLVKIFSPPLGGDVK